MANKETTEIALANWNAGRELMGREHPEWDMPAWSKAPAWRRRPYLLLAKESARAES